MNRHDLADSRPASLRTIGASSPRTLFGVEDGLIAWGRLYMEDVEAAGEDIGENRPSPGGTNRERATQMSYRTLGQVQAASK
jgi:hypothetical protein